MAKEHILVTGGAGYIGSMLVPELLEAGYHVKVVDNFMYGQNSLASLCTHPEFDVINGDVRNDHVIDSVLKEVDIIIPLAALVGAPLCDKDPIGAVTTNRDALQTIVKHVSPNQKILIPISNSGYGVGEKDALCTEESPLRPVSLYGRLKVEAEKIAMERKNTISLRLATVFGMSPRMRIDLLVNNFTFRAIWDRNVVLFESHFKRNFIHVRDVATAFLHSIKNFDSMKDEVYNVGLSDANLTKKELCEKIQEHLPFFNIIEAPIGKDPDQRNYIVSNAKIEKTGFKTKHSLNDGIQELIKGLAMLRITQHANI